MNFKCADGREVSTEGGVKEEILRFYSNLLGTKNIDAPQALLPVKLSREHQRSLMAAVTDEEIYSVIKCMPSIKYHDLMDSR